MELFINDTAIDITPTKDDTVETMLKAVSKELSEGLIIASMEIDGEFAPVDDPEILSKSINSIKRVDLIVATNIEIGLSLLINGKEFIDYSVKELENGSIIKKQEMIESFRWIIESMEALRLSLAFPPTELSIIKAIVNSIIIELDEDDISFKKMAHLSELLKQVSGHIDALAQKLQDPNDLSNKEATKHKLEEIQALLPEIATNFQTGKDLKAIQDLCLVIDAIDMFTRYTASNSEDLILEGHAIDLKDLSTQMLNAFENKDFILISDLIEYDLSDKIDDIFENY
ncbi:MAG: hypothetical protein ACRCTJ_02385 [Brevinema sp.]